MQVIKDLSVNYKKPIVVEVEPLSNFYKAEGYHQDYLDKNPGGYCHIDPSLFEYAKKRMSMQSKGLLTRNRMMPLCVRHYRTSSMP